jgi:FkbM family methyltransferase
LPDIAATQRWLAGSRTFTRLAAKVARFSNGVMYLRLGHDIDMKRNGEEALVGQYAAAVKTFIDVGANVGDWTSMLLSSQPAAEGVLVDPGAAAVRACRERFESASGVQVVEAAVGASPGSVTFNELPGASTHSSVLVRSAGSVARTVPVVTVADIAREQGWSTVSLVKIDVEGFDLQVLRGARPLLASRAIEVLQFEYNDSWAYANDSLRDALEMLGGYGYRVWNLARNGLWEFRLQDYGEFYHHANFVAASPQACATLEPLVRGRA